MTQAFLKLYEYFKKLDRHVLYYDIDFCLVAEISTITNRVQVTFWETWRTNSRATGVVASANWGIRIWTEILRVCGSYPKQVSTWNL